LAVFLLSPGVGAVPLNAFIPFGPGAGDARLAANDDESSGEIALSTPFSFFGSARASLFVNNNGNITFNGSLSNFTPDAFPSVNQIIAAYFADVDTTGSADISGDGLNDVYFSSRTDPADLAAISAIITQAFGGSFSAISAFVATWDHVGYFESHTDLLNTFQLVLVTDGVQSFVIFHYLDNGMTWETGDASGGQGGFGGTQAAAGFDAGNNLDFFTIPGSRLAGIANILQNGSNIDVPGRWIFQVDTSISTPPVLIGDIDADGDLDAMDARLILEVLVGRNPSAAVHFASAGDVNADGVIDNRDSVLILAIVAGRISPPPDQARITVADNDDDTATAIGSAGAVLPGSTVRVVNTANSATTSVQADANGSFMATLAAAAGDRIVFDVNGSPARSSSVVVTNHPPIITGCGAARTISEGDDTALDVQASDPEGSVLTFAWQQLAPAAPTGVFSAPMAAVTTWTAPGVMADTPFTLQVTVRDPQGAASPCQVTVTVNDTPPFILDTSQLDDPTPRLQ
jgi:hypothetical protein